MDILESMKRRHSVRQYRDLPLAEPIVSALRGELEAINREAGLHFQLVTGEPRAFGGRMAHYGKFEGAVNYVVIAGKKCEGFSEKCGYFGERFVMFAHGLGLHTCWVALTYKRVPGVCTLDEGEKYSLVIALGHGRNRGLPRKSKTAEQVSNASEASPEWFRRGVAGALTAPTAMNQQKFKLTLLPSGKVRASAGLGFYTKTDLGIVKYHFELAAGVGREIWA